MGKRTFLLVVETDDPHYGDSTIDDKYWAELHQRTIRVSVDLIHINSLLRNVKVEIYDPRLPFEKLDEKTQDKLIDWCAEGVRDQASEALDAITRAVLWGYTQEEIDNELQSMKDRAESDRMDEIEHQNEMEDLHEHHTEADINSGDDPEEIVHGLVDRDKES